MEHQYRSYSVESSSFLEDLNDPGSCSYSAAHQNIQNNINFTGHFQPQMPTYYDYESRFNIPQQQPIRYDPKSYANPPLGFTNPGSQYDCNNRQQLAAPRCDTFYDGIQYNWRLDSSSPSPFHNAQPSDPRLLRPHLRVNEVNPRIQNQFTTYRVPNNQTSQKPVGSQRYVNRSENCVLQHSNQNQPTGQFSGLQTDLSGSCKRGIDCKPFPSTNMHNEESNRICDRLSQLYRLSSTSPSVQQEISFLQDQLRAIESSGVVSDKSCVQTFYTPQEGNDKTCEVAPHSSQLGINASLPSTYIDSRCHDSVKIACTNNSTSNHLVSCNQESAIKDKLETVNSTNCVATCISCNPAPVANTSYAYVVTPLLPDGPSKMNEQFPTSTVSVYSVVQSSPANQTVTNSVPNYYGERTVSTAFNVPTAYTQPGNVSLPILVTSSSNNSVDSCISSSYRSSFCPEEGMSNGFLENSISQQGWDPCAPTTATAAQNNNSLLNSSVSRSHQNFEDSHPNSVKTTATGSPDIDFTKMNMCTSQNSVLGPVGACSFSLASVNVQQSSHVSTIHYHQPGETQLVENIPEVSYSPFGKNVPEPSCKDTSSVNSANLSQAYQNYGQYVTFTQDCRPNLAVGSYWNQQYQSSLNVNQGIKGESNGQHLKPIAPAPSHSIMGSCAQISGTHCIEMNKFSGLSCNDGSHPPILPKTSSTDSQPVKKTRGRKPLNRGNEVDKNRQRKPRKKQEVETPSKEDQSDATPDPSVFITPATKRPRGRAAKKFKLEAEVVTNLTLDPFAIENMNENPDTKAEKSLSDCKRRRTSVCPVEIRQKRKYRKSLKSTSDLQSDSSSVIQPSETVSPDPSHVPETITQQVKIVRARPRPKKRRPLPTLIKRKKRSAFYGDDSGSEPETLNRAGCRASEIRLESEGANNLSYKRRSERHTGDRKSYTDDLELNLTDDEVDVRNGEVITLNDSADVAEGIDNKIVESVLGRRITKRLVKKITQTEIKSPNDISDKGFQNSVNASGEKSQITVMEEEGEEEVEEFYLKYKSYSYLHCEWRALDEISDPRILPKIRRFEIRQANSIRTEDDDVVLFNPDYVEVERVLDVKVYNNGQLVTTENSGHSLDFKMHSKRPRERNKILSVRETKCKIKNEVGFDDVITTLTTNTQESISEIHSTTPLTDDFNDSENNSHCPHSANADDKNTYSIHKTDPEVDMKSKDIVCTSPVERSSCQNEEKDEFGDINDPTTSPTFKEFEIGDSQLESSAMTDNKTEKDDEVDDKDDDDDTSSPVNVTYYLVKWRSLAYEDATWELSQDVDPAKVKEFYKRRYPPKNPVIPRDHDYKIIRPDPSTWKPIDSSTIYKNNNKLRDYQVEGVNWLTFCWYHHRNCILADEMGLGKTVQSVTFLLEIFKADVQGPFLVIVPLSTVGNWQREFENWSDLNVIIYHGSSVSRSMIQEYEMFYRKRSSGAPRHDVYKFHAVVTTFEVLMNDIEFFGQIHWAAAVIDEAHRLKNKKCKLGEGLRYLDLDHRVLLTGTPLQNNVEELFGLLNFLEPEKFNCSTTFVAEYGELKTEEQVERLKTVLKPMMLRRLKEDVEKSLAPKEETVVEVELTNIQKKYYRAIMERNFSFLCKGSTTNAPNLMNIMMELRKCCNHPFLIKGAEDAILSEAQSNDDTLNEDELAFQTMVYASGKLVLIHKLLPKLRADGHKVLIFSQMIRVLDILEDYLVHQGFQFERIDGRIHGPLRQEAIDRFSVDPDKFVFLLCTKAGGLGINLTAADVVIIYDSDWNPQNDLQAQARCHRIGQQKMVKVYRLITRNTYEREMFDRASLKLGLDRAVLQSMGSKEARQAQMSKKEIEDLLKKGAYGALMDDDKAGEDFCEEDIDQILQSRARVVQLEQGKENSTFSKATFSMSDNRSDIALDDPNFWQKWAKKAGVDETALAMKDLIVQTPRQRRQTSRYSSMVVNEPPNIPSPASFNMSDFEDNANSNSSGDETVIQSSSGRCRSRRNRKNARLSRKSQNTVVKQDKLLVVKECDANAGNDLNLIEPLDRADLFRVERCLLTWSWGQWEQAVSAVSFKRSMQPSDLAYFSCALLDYILRCLPSNSDIRTRAICETLARPGTWKLDIHQVNIAVSEASAKIKCIPPSVPVNMESENFDGQAPILDQNINELSEVKKNDDAVLLSDAVIDVKSCIDSPVPSEYNATGSPVSVVTAPTDASNTSVTKLASADTENIHNKIESIPDMPSEPLEVIGKDDILDKDEDDVDEETHVKTEETQMSPRLAAFKPELLQPNESFKKHVQRAGARLLNRVALLFFLQCEIIGIKSAQDLIASRLSHTDFPELALSLPPLEVLDSDLPALWWDKCCDKCLLLGIMKHGWEKYTAMRLDPKLCFRLRAIEVIQSQCSNIPNVSNDHLQENKEVTESSEDNPEIKIVDCTRKKNTDECELEDIQSVAKSTSLPPETSAQNTGTTVNEVESSSVEDDNSASFSNNICEPLKKDASSVLDVGSVSDDVLLSLPFPQVADLNSRARKLVGYFQRIKNQLGSDASRDSNSTTKHICESTACFTRETNLTYNSLIKSLKSYRFRRKLNCLPKVDVEEAVTCLPFTRLAEAKVLKWTRREEADFYRVVSSFGVEFTEITPDTASNVDGNGDGDQQDEKPNLVIDVDNTETKLHKSLPRKYNWINFRQLANLSRKSDQALVEYFQSFYRMCQRVCKKELTVFAEPASTFATTTTSGSSDLGCEIIIDPISEERASRCLSRIDLLARIRNHILQHPHLEERLKLCQSSSDLPVWWIPGKHDRELLFAAAKYGLARTDLNFLQDSDSSFSRIVHLIREKLTHDPAVTDYPGDLSASPANRYSIAAAAASAARAAAVQLVNEKTTCPTDPPACDTGVSKSDTEDNLDSKKSEIQSSAISLNCQESGSVKTDNELTSVTFEPIGSHDVVTTPSDFTAASNENDAPLNTNGLTLMMDKSDINATTSKEDHSDVKVGQESTAAEWSIKFATNLAISWPKDRTVQHRLELICHTVENNEWPNPHRFITPITTAIPVASSIANCTRSQNESKVTCVDGTIPTNFRSLPSSRDPFTISSNNSRRLPVNNAHVSLSRKQYGLPVFSSDITSNSLPVDSACDSQSSSLTEMSLPLSNNELDESRQFDFCFTGRHINSPLCKPSLHSYTSEALSLTSKTMDAGECISTSVNIPLDIKDNQLSFPSNSTHEIPFSDRNRGRNRNRSSRVNSLGKNIPVKHDKSQTNPDSDHELLSLSNNSLKCATSHSEHFVHTSKSTLTSTTTSMPEDTGFSMPPPSMTSAPRSATGANNRGRKRKNDSSKPQPDDNSFSKVTQSSKRERLSSSKTETSDTQKTSQNTNPDIWDVRVPVISLIDGSLIYGDKAPQRRSLESWLDANPNYMPYSVEMEDRAIYNRVASARGQDTSNMEALAYKHYLNSLLASAASGLHGGVSNSGVETSNSQSSGASQANNFNTQQYLQQQQLLSTFGAYARHPAYANIIASALNSWQSIPTPSSTIASATGSTSGAKSRVPVTTSCAPSTTRSSKSRSAGNRSENSNRRRDSTEIVDSSTSQAYSFAPERTTGNTPVAQGNPFQMSTGNQRVDSMLAAVYQQAAAMNLAYMCNPLTAAALYSQIMLSCSGSANTADIGSSSLNLTSNAPSNQATLASLYANFLLSAKQMQQRQVSQSPGHWDTQQLLTSLAATLASACGSTGEIDTATLLSMFSGAASPSPGMGTTSTPVKHSNIQQQQQPCTQPDNRIHSITTSLASASDLTGSVCSERETQDSGDIRQTVSCRHSDKSQDKYDATKEYEESQTILDLSK